MLFYKLFDILLNLVLWVFILILIVPILILLFLWKSFIILLARLFRPNLHPTNPNDTYFAIDDAKNIPIVNAAQIWRVKGRICVNEFRKHFYSCFLSDEDSRRRYGNFYCYLVKFGGYVFKKRVDEIDLKEKILERTLEPGTDLESWVSKWFLEDKFKEDSPLWEIVILHMPFTCNTEECETVFLYKNHHCLADGYGFIHIVDRLTGNQSPYLVKEEKDSWVDIMKDTLLFPKAVLEYTLGVSTTKDIFYPIKDPNRRWFISLATLDLKCLKEIRREANTHFITVMMSLMIGALRRLILEKQSEEALPKNIYTANSLPWPSHPRTTLVNHWSGGVFDIPFKTGDPLERLREADRFFKHFHDIHMHKMIRRLIIPATWCIPSCLLRLGHAMDLYYFRYSNTFASLMLSDKPHYLLGKKIENMYLPLGLCDNVPTCVTYGVSTSHSGKLDLSIVANSELVSNQQDIDRLTKVYFPMEMEHLKKRLQESNNNDFVVKLA